MQTETELHMRDSVHEDEKFRFSVYASTRAEEIAAWGWDELQQSAFLHMQFELQQRSYRLRFPGTGYQIIFLQDQPVGHLLVAQNDKELTLVDIALLPQFRNLGLGSRIIRALQAEAGSKSIWLQVTKGNPAAHLYARLGFHVAEEKEIYFHMQWTTI